MKYAAMLMLGLVLCAWAYLAHAQLVVCALECPAGSTVLSACSPACPAATAQVNPADTVKDDPFVCTGQEFTDTAYVLTRRCNGDVGYNDYAPKYSGNIFHYADVFGSYPATANFLGKTAIIALAKNQFVSLVIPKGSAFGTVNLVANPSYGSSAISVSAFPGGFVFNSNRGVVCASLRGGSSGIVISNNGSTADCPLDPNKTYYVNMGYVGATLTSTTGSTCTRSPTCYASFTMYKLN